MRRAFSYICGAVFIVQFSALAAETSDKEKASLMYAYFACSIYAEMAGEDSKAKHFFDTALANGRAFFSAYGTEPMSGESRKDIPVAVLWSMSGKTIDFTIGQVFSTAERSVSEDFGAWPSDDAGRMLASVEMLKRNCDLLR